MYQNQHKINQMQSIKRLTKEYKLYQQSLTQQIQNEGRVKDNFIAKPDAEDIKKWYFIVFGVDTKPFDTGFYLGRIEFPHEYPSKAPKIFMMTENGRF